MNSIGNLILHLCGNVRQWIIAGVGTAKDNRNRPAEMVGDKTAQVVTYKLDFDGTSAKMSVWIDTKTQLPLKRVVAAEEDGQKFRITETYSTFAIDPKLDPKLFEIPKE